MGKPSDRLEVDEFHRAIIAHRERYLTAWIAETGLKPSECMLVQRTTPDGITMIVERRPDPPEHCVACPQPATVVCFGADGRRWLTCDEHVKPAAVTPLDVYQERLGQIGPLGDDYDHGPTKDDR